MNVSSVKANNIMFYLQFEQSNEQEVSFDAEVNQEAAIPHCTDMH